MKYFFILLLLTGCAGLDLVNVNRVYPAKPEGCSIALLTIPPTKPFEEVAQLQGHGHSKMASYLESAKAKACELGGDALIFTDQKVAVNNQYGTIGTVSNSTFTVIRYNASSK